MIEAVEIHTRDGTLLRGELWHGDGDCVVLVHDRGRDLDAWRELPAALAERRIGALSFDLRGHGGSGGEVSPAAEEADIGDAVLFARGAGAERVYIGADGGAAPAALAVAEREAVAAFVVAPRGLDRERSYLLPALVVLPRDDPLEERAAELFPGDSLVVTLPESTPLLESGWADTICNYVVRFVHETRLRRARASAR